MIIEEFEVESFQNAMPVRNKQNEIK